MSALVTSLSPQFQIVGSCAVTPSPLTVRNHARFPTHKPPGPFHCRRPQLKPLQTCAIPASALILTPVRVTTAKSPASMSRDGVGGRSFTMKRRRVGRGATGRITAVARCCSWRSHPEPFAARRNGRTGQQASQRASWEVVSSIDRHSAKFVMIDLVALFTLLSSLRSVFL